jgi:hypothetical protein
MVERKTMTIRVTFDVYCDLQVCPDDFNDLESGEVEDALVEELREQEIAVAKLNLDDLRAFMDAIKASKSGKS